MYKAIAVYIYCSMLYNLYFPLQQKTCRSSMSLKCKCQKVLSHKHFSSATSAAGLKKIKEMCYFLTAAAESKQKKVKKSEEMVSFRGSTKAMTLKK